MKVMLDTNTCIYLIKRRPEKILQRFRAYSIGDIGISSITLAELDYGVAKSQHVQKNRVALDEFILPLEIAAFDEAASEKYGAMRSMLEKNGLLIGSMDMLIAAHALSLDVTIVTNNIKECKRVKGLKVVDWST